MVIRDMRWQSFYNKIICAAMFVAIITALNRPVLIAQSGFGQLFTTDLSITAEGFDSHVELRWRGVRGAHTYVVYMAGVGGANLERGRTKNLYFLDFVTDMGGNTSYAYYVTAFNDKGIQIEKTAQVTATVRTFTDDQLMEMVQRYTFRYFWEYADSATGLALERSDDTQEHCVTIGGSGFGIMGLIAGVENGFVTRSEALERLTKIVAALERLPRYKGAWAHWYNARTGEPYRFSAKDNGGDLVETAFLVQGLIAAKGFFYSSSDMGAKNVCDRIEKLWRGVEWQFYTKGEDALYWHWSPDHNFAMNHKIRGYDEALITYILAAGSPTYPISRSVYDNCWVNRTEGEFFCINNFYGIMLPLGKRAQMGGPLFWVHYSYLGLDPRGLADTYADYWQQNRRYTLINRAYCIDNPYNWVGYGENFWGLTACDALPSGYMAHSPGVGHDFGTVAPTAALSSMPYTPAESMAVLKNLYRNYGRETFGIMGFYDAVNMTVKGSISSDNYIAIDQGPILVMIENHRSAVVWNAFMRNGDVRRGLDKLGFTINHTKIKF